MGHFFSYTWVQRRYIIKVIQGTYLRLSFRYRATYSRAVFIKAILGDPPGQPTFLFPGWEEAKMWTHWKIKKTLHYSEGLLYVCAP